MLLCDIIDKLHNKHGLTNAGTAEKTDLTALGIGADKVDDLDARFEYLRTCGKA